MAVGIIYLSGLCGPTSPCCEADTADTLGNLVYRGTQRNWNPVMAIAGGITIAEVDQVCEPGGLDPELVITPGIFRKSHCPDCLAISIQLAER